MKGHKFMRISPRISPAEAFASALLEGVPQRYRALIYSRLKRGAFKHQKAAQKRLASQFGVE
jgi:hypothetical protein